MPTGGDLRFASIGISLSGFVQGASLPQGRWFRCYGRLVRRWTVLGARLLCSVTGASLVCVIVIVPKRRLRPRLPLGPLCVQFEEPRQHFVPNLVGQR